MPARGGPAAVGSFDVDGEGRVGAAGGGGRSERCEGPALLWPAPAQNGVE